MKVENSFAFGLKLGLYGVFLILFFTIGLPMLLETHNLLIMAASLVLAAGIGGWFIHKLITFAKRVKQAD